MFQKLFYIQHATQKDLDLLSTLLEEKPDNLIKSTGTVYLKLFLTIFVFFEVPAAVLLQIIYAEETPYS